MGLVRLKGGINSATVTSYVTWGELFLLTHEDQMITQKTINSSFYLFIIFGIHTTIITSIGQKDELKVKMEFSS